MVEPFYFFLRDGWYLFPESVVIWIFETPPRGRRRSPRLLVGGIVVAVHTTPKPLAFEALNVFFFVAVPRSFNFKWF